MDTTEKMNRTKLKLSDLNPHLMCVLCGGYYIDATTIVECLHSFCRSCIVKHLESSKYCPICEVQVHKTKPLINIRPDKTLQDIVYKLVPGLFANEMRNRRKFYRERPHYMKPNDSESVGEVSDETKVYVNDENITLSLDYQRMVKEGNVENSYREISTPVKSEKRYFKCPTGVTIYHLQKLLKAKYDLNDSNYKVEIFFKDQPLHEDFTLLDISYIYLWKSKGTLDLTFKIYENVIKRQKIDETPKAKTPLERKEVDVRLEPVQSSVEAVREAKSPLRVADDVETLNLEPRVPLKSEESHRREEETLLPVPVAESIRESAEIQKPKVTLAETVSVKHNGVAGEEVKEVQLQISESGVMSVSQIENGDVVRTVEETAPKVTDGFKDRTNTGTVSSKIPKPNSEMKSERGSRLLPEQSKQPPRPAKQLKAIRCTPKSWNPVIPKEKLRPTLMKNSDEPKKPMKFFKMRNMPRFLGNPASGVKPMYGDTYETERKEGITEEKKDSTKALKNILKIDPKTLRPIEKEDMSLISAPSTPNLLTNPFIPNNNHFLFSDPSLLRPNAGNYSNMGKPDKQNNNSSNHNNNSNHNSNNNNNNSNSNNNNSSSNNNNNGNNNNSSSSSSSSSNSSSSSTSNSNTSNSNNSGKGKPSVPSRTTLQNGTFPSLCFPTPDYCSNFFPYQANFSKHANFYPRNEKLDPLIRASQMSPFANLSSFNVAGFHASLPPSISLLLKHQSPHHHHLQHHHHQPQHHIVKKSQVLDKKLSKDESTKETNKNCDDNSLRVAVGNNKKKEKEEDLKKSVKVQEEEESKGTKAENNIAEVEIGNTVKEQEKEKDQQEMSAVTPIGKEISEDNTEKDKTINTDYNEKSESTCQEATSACNADAKPETVNSNDNSNSNDNDNDNKNKSVNDQER